MRVDSRKGEDVDMTDARRERGDASRREIMAQAVNLASVDGLEGLTIGSLATAASRSKGGLVALFGSKQDLQLATVAAAKRIFVDAVVSPALTRPRGLPRLHALVENWLRYSEDRIFTGGCFFAAAATEFDSRSGVVRDAVVTAWNEWRELVETCIEQAVRAGDLDPGTDVAQLAFEIRALLDSANSASLLFDSSEPYARARTAVAQRLSQLRATPTETEG
jgi:AcrR family transcriptional regulator